ncbi:sensor histidine kinase [Oceanobacillus manasiensis]|uniref:sensor histidine kinase n=1 Tax=Oceanobacillus manasiensis TaxID=586413 RepID=UPI0005A8AB2D|nr:HAMP domain-containing sensor histidine kinase [Oceanobacillus manasiensis]
MKLQSQLNAAFTALLIVILAVTGYIIYSLILDMLIEDEQRQLKQSGEILAELINEYGAISDTQLSQFLEDKNLQLIMYNERNNVIPFSTIPGAVVKGLFENNDFSARDQELWEYKNARYVTSRIIITPERNGDQLILLTPLDDLQQVQQQFIFRLLIVFFIGAAAAILLSYFLTNKLVTPLSQLKRQLKKVENRQFDDIERIKATGEIKEVEQSVYEMASELKQYIRSQQTFFQNASHELKTPLMTIQGYAEGIRDGIFDKNEQDKGLEVMVTEVNRLKKIINEMILLAKLDSDSEVYNKERVLVDDLVEQVVDRTLPIVNDKKIQLRQEIEANIVLYADEEKLLRALLNLVFNAIRHANSTVSIKVQKQDNSARILIEDDGEGVAEELMPHIFHRFVKGKTGETGLGLAIARAIIEQSNGKITVHKSEQGGAKFEIVFEG